MAFCARIGSAPGAGAIVAPVYLLLVALHWVSCERVMPVLIFCFRYQHVCRASRGVGHLHARPLAFGMPGGGGACSAWRLCGDPRLWLFWLSASQTCQSCPRRTNLARFASSSPGKPSPPTSGSCEVEVQPIYGSLHVRARVCSRHRGPATAGVEGRRHRGCSGMTPDA